VAVALLRSAPSHIEADLQRFYPGRRIAEFWRTISPARTGEMTPRELIVLVTELPDNSQFKRARATAWTLTEQLAARLVNVLEGQRKDYRNAHGAEHDWQPVIPPELEHERLAREAAEAKAAHHNMLGPLILERMLRGELLMTDIDITKPVEEVLAV
jgi:hypothetical protein